MQQPPQYPPPPGGDPYSPQPWPGAQPAPYQYGSPPDRSTRPGSVTAAAVLLIVLSVVPMLVALALFFGASVFHRANGEFDNTQFSGVFDDIAGVAVAFGIVSLAYGVVKLIAGIKVLSGSNAWRVTGIVFASIAAALWVLSLIGAVNGNNSDLQDTGPNAGGIVFSALLLAANIVVIVLLAKAGEWFNRSPGPTAALPPPQQQWPGQYQG
jgi:hypothetical protein